MANRIAYKTRIHLNNKQSSWMKDNCIAARIAYNYSVAFLRDAMFYPSSYEIVKWWSYERDDIHPWMKRRRLVMSGINKAINVNFAAAMKRWKAAKYTADAAPVFHGRGRGLSVTWDYTSLTNRHIDQRTITLPQKMGTARLAGPMRFDGKIMQVTFSEAGGKWYAAFLIAVETMPHVDQAPTGTSVGVDVGVANFASLSNGEQFPPAQNYAAELEKLAKLQRVLSRMEGPIKGKKKASKNWMKANEKVRAQYRHIANVRRHYTEIVSKDIAERFETVAIEDLKLKNMSKSAKGDAENPGSKVAQKSGLNRSILNGGFFQFRTRLECKVAARGGQVIAVNPAFTSQTCPACGHVAKANRPSQAVFCCVECGHSGHADIVAAQNILHRALAD